MRTSARTSSLLFVVALIASGTSLAAKQADPAVAEIQALLRQAGEAERAENCEAAWLKYKEADGRMGDVVDRAKAAQLESIATNKLDKLSACYHACQPSDRQRNLLEKAQGYAASGEVKRATQMVKRMLVGKNEKCRFWGEARSFLRGLPKQADEQDNDKVDPCEVTAEVRQALDEAKEATRRHREELEAFEGQKKGLGGKLPDVIAFFHAIDATRLKVYELREEFLDCDSVYQPLVGDANELRDTWSRTEALIINTYKGQVAALAGKVKKFQKEMEEKDQQLKDTVNELSRLKQEFDALSSFNEELYDDLFGLAGSESVSFSTNVEGRRVAMPAEEIRAVLADQTKTMRALQDNYPEYFQDGVNLEGLKKKRFVLEKLGTMMEKFGKRGGEEKLGYQRALTEVQSTLQMMDQAIAATEKARESEGDGRGIPIRMILSVVVTTAGVALLGIVLTRRLRRRGRYEE